MGAHVVGCGDFDAEAPIIKACSSMCDLALNTLTTSLQFLNSACDLAGRPREQGRPTSDRLAPLRPDVRRSSRGISARGTRSLEPVQVPYQGSRAREIFSGLAGVWIIATMNSCDESAKRCDDAFNTL